MKVTVAMIMNNIIVQYKGNRIIIVFCTQDGH